MGKELFMKTKNAFLLFEVLVAILIASTVLVVLLQGLGNSLRGASLTDSYLKALLLTESQMAMLEKEYSVSEDASKGRFSDDQDPDEKFSYEQSIKPVIVNSVFASTEIPVCEVNLKTIWTDKRGERSLTLSTYLPKYEESAAER